MSKDYQRIIDAPISSRRAQQIYDFFSLFYDLLTRYEIAVKQRGLTIADIQATDVVLEVGFGTGHILVEVAQRVREKGYVYGTDISSKMVQKSKTLLKQHDVYRCVDLQLGDARQLAYRDNVFDKVFISYVLDLISTLEIPAVLVEFLRVLKPGGRLVLVNLSKGDKWYSNMTLYEKLYQVLPTCLGGCRPLLVKPFVEELGLLNIKREFYMAGHLIPSEIVWGDKPFPENSL